jgi:DNA invertase Pin-like site-specific DNA recombinase
MSGDNKVQHHHLQKKAILYVRQSSAFQAAHNRESQTLQYAMRDQLVARGWHEIEIIDEDLGRSAAGHVERTGFERMVSEVCLGRVGAVAAREVSRFARNSREWQQLVEVCRVVDTLLVDQDTVYSPRLSNDRLLLGLKGTLNEYELDLLRQRAWDARLAKARRGELVVAAPIGFLRTEDQSLEMDPDQRVQEAVRLVFRKFLECGTVRRALLWFLEEEVRLPARRAGETIWRRPTYTTVHKILTNPAYGGAYAYGRTGGHTTRGVTSRGPHRRPPEEWTALIPGRHEGYISWEEFQQIQERIAANCRGPERSGAPKRGAALLSGLIRCGRCGRKLTVHYTGRDHDMARYACLRGWLDQCQPRCISFGGVPVDAAVRGAVLRAVQPAAVEAARAAETRAGQTRDEATAARERELEAARYAAARASRQYNAADPENRLVAAELERRWEQALTRVRELEQRLASRQAEQSRVPVIDAADLAALGTDLEAVWDDPNCDVRLKKRVVQALIREVVADVAESGRETRLVIHWVGGAHTELRVPRRGRGQCSPTAANAIAAVRVLARVLSDDNLAAVLNRHGLRTGRGNRWTAMRVTSLRNHRKIACYRPEVKALEGWLTLTEGAELLGVAPGTLRLAAERNEVPGEHPLPEGPWVFRRADLQTDAARAVAERARHRRGDPAEANPES